MSVVLAKNFPSMGPPFSGSKSATPFGRAAGLNGILAKAAALALFGSIELTSLALPSLDSSRRPSAVGPTTSVTLPSVIRIAGLRFALLKLRGTLTILPDFKISIMEIGSLSNMPLPLSSTKNLTGCLSVLPDTGSK